MALSQRPRGNIARRPNQRCCSRFTEGAWITSAVVGRVSFLIGTRSYPSDYLDRPPGNIAQSQPTRLHAVAGNTTDVSPTQLRADACGTAVGHSTALSRQRRVRSPSLATHSLPCANLVDSCGHRADTLADQRLPPSPPAVVASSSRQRRGTCCTTGSRCAFRCGVGCNGGLRTHTLQSLRLSPPPSTIRPSCRCCAVRSGQPS